jgi:hypothetical protein
MAGLWRIRNCASEAMMTERRRQPNRPTFIIHLRPEPRIDAIKAVRWLLKTALRRFGLRCTSITELNQKGEEADGQEQR